MFSWFGPLLARLRHHPVRVLALLLVGGAMSGFAAWQFYGAYHWRAARQSLETRRFQDALTHLASCLQVWPRNRSVEVVFLAARTARRAGAYEQAQAYLAACEELNAPKEDLVLERALLRAQRGELGNNVEPLLLSFLAKEHPDKVLILEALIQGYEHAFRLKEALRVANQLLQLQPDHAQALVWRGWVWKRTHQPEKALQDYRQALTLDPAFDVARLRLAETLLADKLGPPEEAAEHFEVLCQRDPDNLAALLGLARCRLLLNQPQEAGSLLDCILARNPNNELALIERGRLALSAGQATEAEPLLRKAVRLTPSNRDANYLFSQCLEQLDKKDEARTYAARVERLDADFQRLDEAMKKAVEAPHDPARQREVGLLLLEMGNDRQGLRWLFQALQLDPGHRPTHRSLADYYARVGDQARAAHHRKEADKPSP
jgi:tetratricopeptide (TPR) repeat protein